VAGRIVGVMGKAVRAKQQRRTAPRRKLVVVDACEIGAYNGMVVLRAGSETAPPLGLALPPSPELAGALRSASLDAEEQYWEVLPAALRGVTPGDKAAAMAAVQSWLLGKDWAGVVRRIPPDGGLASLAIVTSWGHVGLVADPPYARRPALAIFDPMQLRRLAPSFQSALAAASAAPPGPPARSWPDAAAAALAFLEAQPWPAQGTGYREPTHDEATIAMRGWHKDFLTREPYIRPPERNLPG
jgi:hypothetical protein